jgi:hypothetical protein
MNKKISTLLAIGIMLILSILVGGFFFFESQKVAIQFPEIKIPGKECSDKNPNLCNKNCNSDKDCQFTCGCNCVSKDEKCLTDINCKMLSSFVCKCNNNKCEFVEFQDETADWKTYKNYDYEYEIKIPEDWIFAQDICCPGPPVVFHFSNCAKDKTESNNCYAITISSFIQEFDSVDSISEVKLLKKDYQYEYTNIDGVKAIKLVNPIDSPLPPRIDAYHYFIKDRIEYRIDFSKQCSLCEKAISTFRFIESSTTDEANCINKCGNGSCEEVVCMTVGCPCGETKENCPFDCTKINEPIQISFSSWDLKKCNLETKTIEEVVSYPGEKKVNIVADQSVVVYNVADGKKESFINFTEFCSSSFWIGPPWPIYTKGILKNDNTILANEFFWISQ